MGRSAGLLSLMLFPAALGAALASCGPPAPEPRMTVDSETVVPVAAEPAEIGRLRAVIHATGTVTPAAGADFIVMAPEPARIVEMPWQEGDPVASGDLLVRFDIPTANADVARQRAEVARALAQIENARITQARARDLFERGIISRREMDDADREVAEGQATVAGAEAALAAAEAAVARTTVHAPFTGIVANRFHDPGDLVQGTAADPVLRIVDPGHLEVTASIPAAEAPRVLPGASARLSSAAGVAPVHLTVVARIAVAETEAGGNVRIRLVFAEPTSLPVDTPLEIDIDGEERVDAVLVPAYALVREGNETVVLVAVGDKAERRIVTTGIEEGEHVEITSGVQAGELIIIRGQTGLGDGTTISVDR